MRTIFILIVVAMALTGCYKLPEGLDMDSPQGKYYENNRKYNLDELCVDGKKFVAFHFGRSGGGITQVTDFDGKPVACQEFEEENAD